MIKELCEGAKSAEKFLAAASNDMKNTALLYMAKGLIDDETVSLPPTPSILKTERKTAFQAGFSTVLCLTTTAFAQCPRG